jgi:hypothetical protein
MFPEIEFAYTYMRTLWTRIQVLRDDDRGHDPQGQTVDHCGGDREQGTQAQQLHQCGIVAPGSGSRHRAKLRGRGDARRLVHRYCAGAWLLRGSSAAAGARSS